VSEDDAELDPVLDDDEELEVVADMLGDIDDDELVLTLESVILDMVDELVLTEPVRVLAELVLLMEELELEELDELLAGPAEYTMAPAGWAIR
jgi:CRISPR/Cas system-associated protein Csm6